MENRGISDNTKLVSGVSQSYRAIIIEQTESGADNNETPFVKICLARGATSF